MLTEIDANNVQFNYEGQVAKEGEPILTKTLITRMILQILQGYHTLIMSCIAEYTFRILHLTNDPHLNVVVCFLMFYKYLSKIHVFRERFVLCFMLRLVCVCLTLTKLLTGQDSPRFSLESLNAMIQEMDANNAKFNYQGIVAQPGEPILSRELINRMIENILQGLTHAFL